MAFMNSSTARRSVRASSKSWPCAACAAKCGRRWMSGCWRHWGPACRTAPASPWDSTVWWRWRWERRVWPTRWHSPATMHEPRLPLVLAARQVLAGASVDAQNLAFVDEQRHPHHGPGLELRGLRAARGGIAAKAGIRLDHFEFHVRRRGDLQGHAVPQGDDAHRAVFQPLGALANRFLGGRELLEGLGRHEMKEVSVAVQILHIRVDHVSSLHGIAEFPSTLDGA